MAAVSVELILHDKPEIEARGPFPTERVAFDKEAWATAPLQLEPDADEAYGRLATRGPFGSWWLSTSGGTLPGIRRFLLSTPPQHWPRPWELMIGALPLRLQHDVSIVRRLGEERLVAQRSEFDEPLRVLLVQGSPSAPGYAEINIEKEVHQIQEAYAGLDIAARSTVSAPVAVNPGSQDLSDCLVAHKPQIVWFSGHGRSDPAGLLLADGNWMSPSDLAKAILDGAAKGAPIPLYVVIWACNSAVQPRFSAPGAAPPFIDALGKIGVSAVLATQAPLADDVAPVLASAVFAGLAAGHPIDVAITRARGAFLSNPGRDAKRLDWACPIVWCSDKPTEAIVWRDGREIAVLRQNAMRRVSAPPGDLVLSEAGKVQARLWSTKARVGVEAPITTSHVAKAEWEARIWSMPRDNQNVVILFDYSRDSVAGVLQNWAKTISANLDQSDDPDRLLRTAAELAAGNPEQA